MGADQKYGSLQSQELLSFLVHEPLLLIHQNLQLFLTVHQSHNSWQYHIHYQLVEIQKSDLTKLYLLLIPLCNQFFQLRHKDHQFHPHQYP